MSRVGCFHATKPKRELRTIRMGRIDRHVEAVAFCARHILTGRPVKFRRRTQLSLRGWQALSGCQLDTKKYYNKDPYKIKVLRCWSDAVRFETLELYATACLCPAFGIGEAAAHIPRPCPANLGIGDPVVPPRAVGTTPPACDFSDAA